MTEHAVRAGDPTLDVDMLVAGLEAHALRDDLGGWDELAGGEEKDDSGGSCACTTTCTCPCD